MVKTFPNFTHTTYRELEDDEYTVGVSEANPYDQFRTVFLFIPGDLPFFHKKVGTKKVQFGRRHQIYHHGSKWGSPIWQPKELPIL